MDIDSDDSNYVALSWFHYLLNTPLQEIIVIRQDNRLYNAWQVFDVINCLVSSYFYAMVSVLDHPKTNTKSGAFVVYFETVFVISFLLNFIVDFKQDGSTIPVKDFKKIAMRYFKNDFLLDFIPLIPIPSLFTLDNYRE